jgi:hypothetical protein
MLKYSIDLKANINETDLLLNTFANKLIEIHPEYYLPGVVQIFSNHIQYIGGPKIKVSTSQHPIANIDDCIAEFNGKLEHYGNPRVTHISLIQTLKFSDLNEDSLELVKHIENDMNILFKSKPSRMSANLWLDFESLISSYTSDKAEDIAKKRSKMLDFVASMDIDKAKIIEVKYRKICNALSHEKSKPKELRDTKMINTKSSLANYYVKKYGITRRHFSTSHIDFNKMNEDILNEYRNSTHERYQNMKAKYPNHESFINREFINSLKDNHQKLKHFIISADFETIVHNDKHYVFCSSIHAKPSKVTKDTQSEFLTISDYIAITNLSEDLSNIDELSSELLLTFWRKLIHIKSTYYYKIDVPILYFHNMDKFDGVFILKLVSILLDNNIVKPEDVNIIQRNNIIYQIKINDLIIRDSLHILPGSLSMLAKTFLKDSKKDIDIKFDFNSITSDIVKITEYCNHDTYLLYNVLASFRNNMLTLYNTDPIAVLTISSLSFKILRKFFIEDRTIENTSNNSNKHEFIHKSYRGGYCGVLIPMEEKYKLTHIDINSSYPSSMTLDLPTRHGIWVKSEHLEVLNNNMEYINSHGFNMFGFFDVLIKVESKRSLSPLIIRYNSKLTDVTGTIRVTVFSEELKFIMDNGGTLIEIYSGLIYESSKLLKNFAETLYAKRKSSNDETEQLIYKLILNSAYGRFALKDSMEVSTLTTNEQYEVINNYRTTSNEVNIGEKHMMFNIHRNTDSKNISMNVDDPHLNKVINMKIIPRALRAIQIASAITSYSRINLLSMCYKIEDLGGRVYYVDTDSIYTDLSQEKVRSIGNISDKLGDWKIENINLRGIFVQPKFYITSVENDKKKIKLKSIPRHAIKELEANEAVWSLFKSRLSGIPLVIETDKYFLRNMNDQSINVRRNIRFILSNKAESKRFNVIENDQWVGTQSLNIVYNSNVIHKKTYKTPEILNSTNFKVKSIIDGFSEFIKSEIPNHDYKFSFLTTCIVSSYELAKYEIKVMLSYDCTHFIRLIMRIEGRLLSSAFIELHEALEYICDIEERYEFMKLDWIKIASKITNHNELHLNLVCMSFASIFKACGNGVSIDDARPMLQSFIKVVKDSSSVLAYEEYYEEIHDYINIQTDMIMNTLTPGSGKEYATLRQFIIDEIITDIKNTSSDIVADIVTDITM